MHFSLRLGWSLVCETGRRCSNIFKCGLSVQILFGVPGSTVAYTKIPKLYTKKEASQVRIWSLSTELLLEHQPCVYNVEDLLVLTCHVVWSTCLCCQILEIVSSPVNHISHKKDGTIGMMVLVISACLEVCAVGGRQDVRSWKGKRGETWFIIYDDIVKIMQHHENICKDRWTTVSLSLKWAEHRISRE